MTNRHLNDDDSRTLDVYVENHTRAGLSADSEQPVTAASPDNQKRVAAVSKILHLLDHMTVQDPPRDLVAATLLRIDQAVSQENAISSELDGTVYGLPSPV